MYISVFTLLSLYLCIAYSAPYYSDPVNGMPLSALNNQIDDTLDSIFDKNDVNFDERKKRDVDEKTENFLTQALAGSPDTSQEKGETVPLETITENDKDSDDDSDASDDDNDEDGDDDENDDDRVKREVIDEGDDGENDNDGDEEEDDGDNDDDILTGKRDVKGNADDEDDDDDRSEDMEVLDDFMRKRRDDDDDDSDDDDEEDEEDNDEEDDDNLMRRKRDVSSKDDELSSKSEFELPSDNTTMNLQEAKVAKANDSLLRQKRDLSDYLINAESALTDSMDEDNDDDDEDEDENDESLNKRNVDDDEDDNDDEDENDDEEEEDMDSLREKRESDDDDDDDDESDEDDDDDEEDNDVMQIRKRRDVDEDMLKLFTEKEDDENDNTEDNNEEDEENNADLQEKREAGSSDSNVEKGKLDNNSDENDDEDGEGNEDDDDDEDDEGEDEKEDSNGDDKQVGKETENKNTGNKDNVQAKNVPQNTPLTQNAAGVKLENEIQKLLQTANRRKRDTLESHLIYDTDDDASSGYSKEKSFDKKFNPNDNEIVGINPKIRIHRTRQIKITHLGGDASGPLATQRNLEQNYRSYFSEDAKGSIKWEAPKMLDNCWAQAMLASRYGFSPSCNSDGSFSPKQCYLERCWCVHRDGSPQSAESGRFSFAINGIMLKCTQNP